MNLLSARIAEELLLHVFRREVKVTLDRDSVSRLGDNSIIHCDLDHCSIWLLNKRAAIRRVMREKREWGLTQEFIYGEVEGDARFSEDTSYISQNTCYA